MTYVCMTYKKSECSSQRLTYRAIKYILSCTFTKAFRLIPAFFKRTNVSIKSLNTSHMISSTHVWLHRRVHSNILVCMYVQYSMRYSDYTIRIRYSDTVSTHRYVTTVHNTRLWTMYSNHMTAFAVTESKGEAHLTAIQQFSVERTSTMPTQHPAK